MRVCHIVPSMDQRSGGPSVSVPALATALAEIGHEVEVLTTAVEGGGRTQAGSLMVRRFPRDWPGRLCASAGLRAALRATTADVIHHHSLWLRPLHYAREAARRRSAPLVISPRGMMSPWAWQHHALRKRVAAAFIHPGALAAAQGWHATSVEEAADIRRLGFRQPVCVAPTGVTLPPAEQVLAARATWHERCPALRGRPVALFYSRFHRKKRLRELLQLWLAESRGDWFLLIAGLPEEYTLAEVRGWITAAHAAERVAAFDGSGLPAPYGVASLFLLPSHSENFGLVIAEAMAAGVPALVTDQTPWGGLNRDDRGWCVPWNDYHRNLVAALAEGPDQLRVRGARAQRWVLEEYSWANSARDLAAFYRQLSEPSP